jgi:hypothetical protein
MTKSLLVGNCCSEGVDWGNDGERVSVVTVVADGLADIG